ncbi:MAG: aminotransferase class III-fold pyridoxal phosphate-dependent enzyme [Spirochaetales bacterium]|nr:aminotransferase class III-fold pyridoxal phosphate-dependent enzyme [Spirochaetales bacterium]
MELALAFRSDPRFRKIREDLLALIGEYQGKLAFPGNKEDGSYEKLLHEYGQYRGAGLYYPYLSSGLGRGALVELADGSVKIDFICGIGVHFMGHGHPALLEAALDAALEGTIMQGNLQQSTVALDVARLLLQKAAPMERVFFSTSGAMANENALKIALHNRFPARRILAFERGFAGRTLALSSVTDKAAYREGLPEALCVDYLPFYDPALGEASTVQTLQKLDEYIRRYPGGHALLILEVIQGEAGFSSGSPAFFTSILARAREAGILILIDEIQTFGRTTELFAAQNAGIMDYADIITVGKLTQICATLYRKELQPRPGLLSQTFTGATAAFYGARSVLSELLSGNYYGPQGRISGLARRVRERLSQMASLSEVRIFGSMVSFVVGRGEPEKIRSLVQDLYARGLICFTAGSEPLRIRFLLPAGCLQDEELDLGLAILEETVQDR